MMRIGFSHPPKGLPTQPRTTGPAMTTTLSAAPADAPGADDAQSLLERGQLPDSTRYPDGAAQAPKAPDVAPAVLAPDVVTDAPPLADMGAVVRADDLPEPEPAPPAP